MKTVTQHYQVAAENIQRFYELNEAMREMTAHAEFKFYRDFNDLSLMQIHVLRIINYHKPCPMSQIATVTQLTKGSVTQIIDKLIDKHYVRRIHAENDRRVIYAELTAKGKKVINASSQHVTKVGEKILAKFNEKEQTAFLEFFGRMVSS